jgi:hypothetical protein
VGAGVNKRERALAAKRLLAMNATIRSLADTIADAATFAAEADEKGLAFACHMLRESLLTYAKAFNKYGTRVLKDDLDD